jgi:hypothetical protein
MSFKWGSHMTEQMNEILEMTSWPMVVKSLEGLDGSFPTQSRRVMPMSMANQRQILVAFGVLDFIDAKWRRLDRACGTPVPWRRHVRPHQTPCARKCESTPGSLSTTRRAPNGLGKAYTLLGQGAVAIAPLDFLDGHHAAAAAVDTPHGIEQEDEKSPQGNKLEAPFAELIIARAG